MMRTNPRQSCTYRRRRAIGGPQGPSVTNPTVSALEHPSSAFQDEDSEDMDFSAPQKSRLSAPQLQAQLPRLPDRSCLRRLKRKPFCKGAWQQVARIEDLCRMRVSHKWVYHLDACAGSVLTPHDCITNVQRRLGDRAWTGIWRMPLFLEPQLEHGETCSAAEATRGHHTCVRAAVWALLRNAEGSQLRNPGRLIFSPPLLSQDAAPPWMYVSPPLKQLQPEETMCRRYLVANSHAAETKFRNCAADIASSRNGQQMSATSLQRGWKHEIQIALLRRSAAMTRAVLPNPSTRTEWLLAGIIDRALHH